jgi:hypothetical protein
MQSVALLLITIVGFSAVFERHALVQMHKKDCLKVYSVCMVAKQEATVKAALTSAGV